VDGRNAIAARRNLVGLIQSEQNPAIRRSQVHKIWDTSARAIENQQLMFGKNGFCDYGAHATWPNDAHNGSDRMDKQDNQITHAGF